MERLLTLKEFEAEWRTVLPPIRISLEGAPSPGDATAMAAAARRSDEEHDDPFDCSSLAIPSLQELVEKEAKKFVREWRDLDGRKVVLAGEEFSESHDPPDGDKPSQPLPKKRKRKVATRAGSGMPSWYDHPNRVRLPERFDYLCRHSSAQEAVEAAQEAAGSAGEATLERLHDANLRVLSLADPSSTTSYHSELWALFSRIPTANELESAATAIPTAATRDASAAANAGAGVVAPSLPRVRELFRACGWDRTRHPRRGRTSKSPGGGGDDADDRGCLLARLRLPDRHEAPPFSPSDVMAGAGAATATGPGAISGGTIAANSTNMVATIRFECWRSPSLLPSPSALPEYVRSRSGKKRSHRTFGSDTLLFSSRCAGVVKFDYCYLVGLRIAGCAQSASHVG
jgi:hypothetical protein